MQPMIEPPRGPFFFSRPGGGQPRAAAAVPLLLNKSLPSSAADRASACASRHPFPSPFPPPSLDLAPRPPPRQPPRVRCVLCIVELPPDLRVSLRALQQLREQRDAPQTVLFQALAPRSHRARHRGRRDWRHCRSGRRRRSQGASPLSLHAAHVELDLAGVLAALEFGQRVQPVTALAEASPALNGGRAHAGDAEAGAQSVGRPHHRRVAERADQRRV